MSAADFISARDRDLMKRLTLVLAFVFLFTAAFSTLNRTYSQKFLATTGTAQWIWAQHRMSSNEPVAFFAARDFDLPAKRYYTRLKIAADPEYELFLNGRQLAGRRTSAEEPELDLYDVSQLVRTGHNRVVIAVRAPQGVGGLLASIDIAPETENWVVSDGSWTIYRRWHPDLLVRNADVPSEPPMIVGPPPVGRWNYPVIAARALTPPPARTLPPRESFPLIAQLPAIRTRGGVAVAVAEHARATAFDFGFTRGRVRLTRDFDHGTSRVVNVRFANIRPELELVEWNLRPIVFAPGERSVTTTESHSFRYVLVFGRGITAEVVQ